MWIRPGPLTRTVVLYCFRYMQAGRKYFNSEIPFFTIFLGCYANVNVFSREINETPHVSQFWKWTDTEQGCFKGRIGMEAPGTSKLSCKGLFFFSPYYRSAVETIFYGFFCYLSIMLLFTRPQKMNGLVVRRSRSLYCSVCFGTRVSLSMAYEYPGSHMI